MLINLFNHDDYPRSTLIDKQEAISKKINKINPMIKRASWMKKLVLKILWIKRNVNYGQ